MLNTFSGARTRGAALLLLLCVAMAVMVVRADITFEFEKGQVVSLQELVLDTEGLSDSVSFSVTKEAYEKYGPLDVCMRIFALPSTRSAGRWVDTCEGYAKLNLNNETASATLDLPLVPIGHALSVALAVGKEVVEAATITLLIDLPRCAQPDQFYAQCIQTQSLDGNNTMSAASNASAPALGVYEVRGANLRRVHVALSVSAWTTGDKEPLIAWSLNRLPDASKAEKTLNGAYEFVVSVPRARDRLYVWMENDDDKMVEVDVKMSVAECKAGTVASKDKCVEVTPMTVTKPGETQLIDVKGDTWTFFSMEVNVSSESVAPLSVAVASLKGSAQKQPLLVARYEAAPLDAAAGGLAAFDYKNCNLAACGHVNGLVGGVLAATQAQSQVWYLAVKGNEGDLAYAAVLWWLGEDGAECAEACDGHGVCDEASLQCTCVQGYETVSCSEETPLFEPWEWALIVGGGVLLAIGIIGCIVYFIQKQQRRVGFEKM